MCDANSEKGCRNPSELKGKPEDCSAGQIKKCHSGGSDHPCVGPSKDNQAD